MRAAALLNSLAISFFPWRAWRPLEREEGSAADAVAAEDGLAGEGELALVVRGAELDAADAVRLAGGGCAAARAAAEAADVALGARRGAGARERGAGALALRGAGRAAEARAADLGDGIA